MESSSPETDSFNGDLMRFQTCFLCYIVKKKCDRINDTGECRRCRKVIRLELSNLWVAGNELLDLISTTLLRSDNESEISLFQSSNSTPHTLKISVCPTGSGDWIEPVTIQFSGAINCENREFAAEFERSILDKLVPRAREAFDNAPESLPALMDGSGRLLETILSVKEVLQSCGEDLPWQRNRGVTLLFAHFVVGRFMSSVSELLLYIADGNMQPEVMEALAVLYSRVHRLKIICNSISLPSALYGFGRAPEMLRKQIDALSATLEGMFPCHCGTVKNFATGWGTPRVFFKQSMKEKKLIVPFNICIGIDLPGDKQSTGVSTYQSPSAVPTTVGISLRSIAPHDYAFLETWDPELLEDLGPYQSDPLDATVLIAFPSAVLGIGTIPTPSSTRPYILLPGTDPYFGFDSSSQSDLEHNEYSLNTLSFLPIAEDPRYPHTVVPPGNGNFMTPRFSATSRTQSITIYSGDELPETYDRVESLPSPYYLRSRVEEQS